MSRLRHGAAVRVPCLLLVAVAVACASPEPAPEIIYAGHFVTLDPERAEVEALAVRRGRIVAAGPRSEIETLADGGTSIVEIPGVAVPGFADAHVHPGGVGQLLERLNLRGLTKEQILERVAEAADSTPAGEWIFGSGWDEGFFESPEFPTAADIDAVSPDHPVVLTRIDGHSSVVNSRVLELAGISKETADPDGGRIVRHANGRPTGMLVDEAQGLIRGVTPSGDSPEERERHLRRALQQYAEWGLTSFHDAGADLQDIAIYKKLLEDGELPVRVYAMARGSEAVEHYLGRGPEIDLGDGLLSVRSFKVGLDGALGSRGALLAEPYTDAPDELGLRQMTEAEFDALIRQALDAGFQVNAHAIGDAGVRWGLDAFEGGGVTPDHRFRIEHASIIAPDDLARFAELGVVASMQPVFVGEYGRWAEDRVGPERVRWVLPIRDLLATRAVIASGTDFTASDTGDPIDTLCALVNRTGADGGPEGGWYGEQRVGVDAALRSMSIGPAYAAFQEDDLGQLTVGRYADFTVLSADPREVPSEELRGLDVRMTVMGGRVTFDADAPS